MNTLFDDSQYIVKPRSTDGTFCTTRTKKTIDRLRTCIVGEVRRRDVFWKQLRQRDEEILAYPGNNYLASFRDAPRIRGRICIRPLHLHNFLAHGIRSAETLVSRKNTCGSREYFSYAPHP